MATRSGEDSGGRRRARSRGDQAPEPIDDRVGGDAGARGELQQVAVGTVEDDRSSQSWRETVWSAPRPRPSWAGPADDSHLRPFTTTAQVPRVPGAVAPGSDPRFEPTGMVQAVPFRRRPRPPLGLRLAVWLVALALLAATAGLVVHRIRPQWLRALEVGPQAATGQPPRARTPSVPTTTAPKARHRATVTQTQQGFATATMAVQASTYDVVVTAPAACWVLVSSPTAFTPLFQGVMAAGSSQGFASSEGQLTVQLGASHVVVQVQVGGRTVPGWQFTPSVTPFTLNFTSSP